MVTFELNSEASHGADGGFRPQHRLSDQTRHFIQYYITHVYQPDNLGWLLVQPFLPFPS